MTHLIKKRCTSKTPIDCLQILYKKVLGTMYIVTNSIVGNIRRHKGQESEFIII